jgi:hypothetical protein
VKTIYERGWRGKGEDFSVVESDGENVKTYL